MSTYPPQLERDRHWTAFLGSDRLASGTPATVALAVGALLADDPDATVAIFDDATGRPVDFDPRGSAAEVARRLPAPWQAATPGPAVRDVTLLPRQWDWLEAQPGGASGTLRRLVDAARRSGFGTREAAMAAADAFMRAALGDRPGYEAAARALYASDRAGFDAASDAWPPDLRDHARRLAAPALQPSVSAAP